MKAKEKKKAATVRRPVASKLWQLRLYVTDETPKSQAAISNLRAICETYLTGRYRLVVVDLLKHPQLAKGDQILAIPTLVRRLPSPMRTIIGNLSDIDNVLVGLDLRASHDRT
jgi:circadian clock protein KaiB